MIRRMAHAGSFYPRFGEQISTMIDRWTEDQPAAGPGENCLGLIVPHAGYVYSGACAAMGYQHISQIGFDSFIILHPSHQGAHFGFAVSPFEQYDTPLGRLDLDVQLYELLSADPGNSPNERRLHEIEHSLEIQLPMIKHFFPDALICPVMIGRPGPELASRLALGMRKAMEASGRRIGIIVSTDLSHYHAAQTAEKLDGMLVRHLANLDADGLWQSILARDCEACGIGGLLTLLEFARHYPESKVKVIQYTHSGKVSGDNQQVVGYLSAMVYAEGD